MINRVVLVGRLTKDVEVRKTQTGLSVASFTVACDRRTSRSQDGNQQTADFINCVAWRQSADFLGQYARKGALVGVEGRIQTRSYDRQDGTKQYVTEVLCDNVSLLESSLLRALHKLTMVTTISTTINNHLISHSLVLQLYRMISQVEIHWIFPMMIYHSKKETKRWHSENREWVAERSATSQRITSSILTIKMLSY